MGEGPPGRGGKRRGGVGREGEGLSPNENPGYGLDETKLTLVNFRAPFTGQEND